MHSSEPNWAVMTPRCGFFAKDGRGWYAGRSNRAHSLMWPRPMTVRGALCTAVGREVEAERGRPNTRAEWLALKDALPLRAVLALRAPADADVWTAEHLMWPAPADALHLAGSAAATRLRWRDPREGIAGMLGPRDDDRVDRLDVGFMETSDKPAAGPSWWSHAQLVGWLCGNDDASPPPLAGKGAGLPHRRVDTHVKIDPRTGTAEDSKLWSHDFIETLVMAKASGDVVRWAVAAAVTPTGEGVATHLAGARAATLGADRHLSTLEPSAKGLGSCPQVLLDAVAERRPRALRLYIMTPMSFSSGWCPDQVRRLGEGRGLGVAGPGGIGEIRLTGAVMDRAIPLTGWQMQASSQDGAPGHRGVDWAIPPGAVFGIQRPDGEPFTPDDVEALWLAQWGRGLDDGLGVLVAGLEPTTPDTKALP